MTELLILLAIVVVLLLLLIKGVIAENPRVLVLHNCNENTVVLFILFGNIYN